MSRAIEQIPVSPAVVSPELAFAPMDIRDAALIVDELRQRTLRDDSRSA
jgi:hypothetical protein